MLEWESKTQVQHLGKRINCEMQDGSRGISPLNHGEIYDRKSKAIAFVVNAGMNIIVNHFNIYILQIWERSFFVTCICLFV